MKIGLPLLEKAEVNELKLDTNLHSSAYFGVYDTSDKSMKVLSTNELSEGNQGMGFIQFLKDENIVSVISPECHTMAAKLFSDHKIGVYKAIGRNAILNIALLTNNELALFNAQSAINSKCDSNCSDCSTTCSTSAVDQDVVAI